MQQHQVNYIHATGQLQGYYSAWNDPSLAPADASLIQVGDTHYADVDAIHELNQELTIG